MWADVETSQSADVFLPELTFVFNINLSVKTIAYIAKSGTFTCWA